LTAVAPHEAPAAEATPPYDRRRNASFLIADLAMFLTGMAFASPQTLLPAFAERLDAPNVVIGAIPALMSVGWTLPSIFAANHAQGLARKLPFIVRLTVFERLPYFVLGIAAIWLAPVSPPLTLALLLVMLLLMTVTGGVLMPAWLDVIASVVPATARGRFFALANGLGALLGVGGAAAVGYILDAYGYPQGYGICFLLGTVFLALSYLALTRVREPPATTLRGKVPTVDFLRRLPSLVREDRNLLRLIVARSIAGCGQMATGFYTVYALKVLDAPDAQVGVFTLIVLASQTLGNFGLGWLADRRGHVLVLALGALGGALGAAAALVAPSLAVLYLSFVGLAITTAANNVSGFSIGMEIGPETERPTYTAINTSSQAPVQLIAPVLGGLLADAAGYAPLFALSTALSLLGAAALFFGVRNPRRA
jgi:MFS family permease